MTENYFIQVLNDTPDRWVKPVTITLADKQTGVIPIVDVQIVFDEEVLGRETIWVGLPITMGGYVAPDANKVYEVNFTFRRREKPFGTPFTVKMKCVPSNL